MMGWGLIVTVDPAVLMPVGGNGGVAGYFLYDWSLANYPPMFPGMPMPYPPNFLPPTVGDDYIDCAEMFLDIPSGAGESGGKLCTLYFVSVQNTYSEITIDLSSGYQDKAGNQYLANPIDGHYNMPPNSIALDCTTGAASPLDPSNPIGSGWHEIQPEYSNQYTLTSWKDNGDLKLSGSDQIDITDDTTGDVTWWHIEWFNPDFDPATDQGDGEPDLIATSKADIPEYPSGVGLLMILAPLIPLAYLWRIRKEVRTK